MSLYEHLDRLANIHEKTQNLSERIRICADVFDGGLPKESPPSINNTIPGVTINTQFSGVISGIFGLLEDMHEDIERLERQILAPTPDAPSTYGLTGHYR